MERIPLSELRTKKFSFICSFFILQRVYDIINTMKLFYVSDHPLPSLETMISSMAIIMRQQLFKQLSMFQLLMNSSCTHSIGVCEP